MNNSEGTRINKYLSEVGYCSRREADRLIEQQRVSINGEIPSKGTKIFPGDEVRVDTELVSEPREDFVYIAFNKPKGIVCTTDTIGEKDNIVDFIGHKKRIFPIGRLDKLSEGLIFLTNDGDIVNKILRSENNHSKEYKVTVDKPITDQFIRKMSSGVPILNTVTKKCEVTQVDKHTFKIVLTEGLNRQIRKMCEHLEYKVKRLRRIRIMNVNLDVPSGNWRNLTAEELKEINKLVATSSKSTFRKRPNNGSKSTRVGQHKTGEGSTQKSSSKRNSLGFKPKSKAVNRFKGNSSDDSKPKSRPGKRSGGRDRRRG